MRGIPTRLRRLPFSGHVRAIAVGHLISRKCSDFRTMLS
jgi:hypothetical protein